ncbi:hypothetical protein GCM10020227_08300 [Streptomyces flavovirens]
MGASVSEATASASARSTGASGIPSRVWGRGGTAARTTWTNRVERSRRVRGTRTSIRCRETIGGAASKPYRASAARPVTIASPYSGPAGAGPARRAEAGGRPAYNRAPCTRS